MGRSVSRPHNAQVIAFRTFDPCDPDDTEFEWRDFLDWVKDRATELWPSFTPCDKWLGREDHAVLCNAHAYLGVSEYCGLVAVWLVPDSDAPELAEHWCNQVADKFLREFSELKYIGSASNGEAFFERVQP